MKTLALLSATAAAVLALAGADAWAQPAPAAAAASAPAETVRQVIAGPLSAARDLLAAGKFTEALAKVAEAEAVAGRTPYENFILDQLRGAAAAGAGDLDTAMRSFEAALATGRLKGADALRILEGMVQAALQKKDLALVVRWGERYLQDGGQNPAVRRQVAVARFQTNDFAGAAKDAQGLVAAEEQAGRRPPEDLLRVLGAAQARLSDEAGYAQTLEKLLRHHAKPAYWRDRVSRVQRAAGFDDAAVIDSFRLLAAVGAMEDASEYANLAELALRAGLPGEAKRTLDAAAAAGKAGTGAEAMALRDRVNKAAAEDAATLSTTASANASAAALVAQGLALAGAGRAGEGAPLVQQGLAKGGIAKPELARLRQAWVLVLAGQADGARAVLRDLQAAAGGVGDLARLWLIHLDRPAAPPRT